MQCCLWYCTLDWAWYWLRTYIAIFPGARKNIVSLLWNCDHRLFSSVVVVQGSIWNLCKIVVPNCSNTWSVQCCLCILYPWSHLTGHGTEFGLLSWFFQKRERHCFTTMTQGPYRLFNSVWYYRICFCHHDCVKLQFQTVQIPGVCSATCSTVPLKSFDRAWYRLQIVIAIFPPSSGK